MLILAASVLLAGCQTATEPLGVDRMPECPMCSTSVTGNGPFESIDNPVADPMPKSTSVQPFPAAEFGTDGTDWTATTSVDATGTATDAEALVALRSGSVLNGDVSNPVGFTLTTPSGITFKLTEIPMTCTVAIDTSFSFTNGGTNGPLTGCPVNGGVYDPIEQLPSTEAKYGCWVARISTNHANGVTLAPDSTFQLSG